DDPVAVAGQTALRAVDPVLHGGQDGAHEADEPREPGFAVEPVPPLLDPLSVPRGQPDILTLTRLLRVIGVERPEVDPEGRPAREGLVEEVDGEVAGDTTIREPAPLRLHRFSSLLGVLVLL